MAGTTQTSVVDDDESGFIVGVGPATAHVPYSLALCLHTNVGEPAVCDGAVWGRVQWGCGQACGLGYGCSI